MALKVLILVGVVGIARRTEKRPVGVAAAEFAVGLDSGLMHLAVALSIPGVWLYGPTDPGLTGPYGDGQTVIRSTWPKAPCRRRICADTPGGDCCMRAIGVAEVAESVRGMVPNRRSSQT